ncbi:PREDICTED: WD repeat-containing protein 25-like isoform X2 [Priapulus caudatus]|uniref:WD repeat-containing protein 25-like isoform X2 n=1 Tax=Priapulus caudatus TaxID=37621 RepID=A0ABM1ECF9_PRICU|nr:PREDICTED: WD repeat-containing protein 25-like isoform X2 [Priapulus caudatus]
MEDERNKHCDRPGRNTHIRHNTLSLVSYTDSSDSEELEESEYEERHSYIPPSELVINDHVTVSNCITNTSEILTNSLSSDISTAEMSLGCDSAVKQNDCKKLPSPIHLLEKQMPSSVRLASMSHSIPKRSTSFTKVALGNKRCNYGQSGTTVTDRGHCKLDQIISTTGTSSTLPSVRDLLGNSERQTSTLHTSGSSTVHRDSINSFIVDQFTTRTTQSLHSQSTTPVIRPYSSKRQRVNREVLKVPENSICRHFAPYPEILACIDNNSRDMLPRQQAFQVRAHAKMIGSISWCKRLDWSHLLASTSMDGHVKVWDIVTRKCVQDIASHSGSLKAGAVWSWCGKYILSGSFDKTAQVTNVETGTPQNVFQHANIVTCVQRPPNDDNIIITAIPDSILTWDVRVSADRPIRTNKAKFGRIQDIEFLPGGAEFLCCGDEIHQNSADVAIMEKYGCLCLRVHPNGKEFIAQTSGDYIASFSTLRPYKMNPYKRLSGHHVHSYPIKCDFSRDGNYVVSGSCDGLVHYYHYASNSVRHSVQAYDASDPCVGVAFHPVLPATVASSSESGVLTIWE